jgi:hypothetical protein
MASDFVEARQSERYDESNDWRFFEALQALGPVQNVDNLLDAFARAKDQDLVRVLSERLLRAIFEDHRTGWGQISISRLNEDGSEPRSTGLDVGSMALRAIWMLLLMKLFPALMRWRLRRKMRSGPKGISQINYWGLEGASPALPKSLTDVQRKVLDAFARKTELWTFRTNLWELFALPSTADGLRQFVSER